VLPPGALVQSETRITLLAGGVGGARLAVGFDRLEGVRLTVIVNVADDDVMYGQYVAADLDTVTYTLAGEQGPAGWGRRKDTWNVMTELSELGLDTSFRLGDSDLAVTIYRTLRLAAGSPLSEITGEICRRFGIAARLLPASDDPIRTRLTTTDEQELSFQDYFVLRRHQDSISRVRYEAAERARPAPGVLEAIGEADLVVIAPSNPILSILPITAVPAIGQAVADCDTVVAVSPLVGGKAVKGPAVEMLAATGHPPGHEGIVKVYAGLITHLVVDDAFTSPLMATLGTDTMIGDPDQAARLASEVIRWVL
jgi:LPPG:FO 2-phospho-L-lactate transferase